jgi:hypothetical protein
VGADAIAGIVLALKKRTSQKSQTQKKMANSCSLSLEFVWFVVIAIAAAMQAEQGRGMQDCCLSTPSPQERDKFSCLQALCALNAHARASALKRLPAWFLGGV